MSSVNNPNRTPIYHGKELMGYRLGNTPTVNFKNSSLGHHDHATGKMGFIPFLAFALASVIKNRRDRNAHRKQENTVPSRPIEYDHLWQEGDRIAAYRDGRRIGYLDENDRVQIEPDINISPKMPDSIPPKKEPSESLADTNKPHINQDRELPKSITSDIPDAAIQTPPPQQTDNHASTKELNSTPKTNDTLELDGS